MLVDHPFRNGNSWPRHSQMMAAPDSLGGLILTLCIQWCFFSEVSIPTRLKLEICRWLRFFELYLLRRCFNISKLQHRWMENTEDYLLLLLGVFRQFFRGNCFCRIARFQGRCAVTRRMMLLTMAKCGKLGAEILTGCRWPMRYVTYGSRSQEVKLGWFTTLLLMKIWWDILHT